MRERWFADDRDLVKWTALLRVAEHHEVTRILQVCYAKKEPAPNVTIGEEVFQVRDEVWMFFRDLHRISELGARVGITIGAITEPFDPRNRGAYQQIVNSRIRAHRPGPLLLFLDPDTGLEPGKADGKHTAKSELSRYWRELEPGDSLALYQHARRKQSWDSDVARELSTLCGSSRVTIAKSNEIGKDVALLFATKC